SIYMLLSADFFSADSIRKRNVYGNFLLKFKLMKIQTLTMETMDLRLFQKRFFSDDESFCERDTESEEDEDSDSEDVNNS
ncbi:hypothetical protein AVEN_164628-1, partial [Araneus ventricosus]